MACIGSSPASTEIQSTPFPRARRHALIPPNCCRSAEEASDPVRPKPSQPQPNVFPTSPDLIFFQSFRTASPPRSVPSSDSPVPSIEDRETRELREQSPASSHKHSRTLSSLPKAITRDSRRRAAHLKAQAHHARDRQLEQRVSVSPKASPLAFLLNEELETRLEDREDTPHISEVTGEDFAEDDMIEHMPTGVLGTDTPHISTFMPGEDVKAEVPTMEESWVSRSGVETAELSDGSRNAIQRCFSYEGLDATEQSIETLRRSRSSEL